MAAALPKSATDAGVVTPAVSSVAHARDDRGLVVEGPVDAVDEGAALQGPLLLLRVLRGEGVSCPLPDVAHGREHAVGVGGEGLDRRDAVVAVLEGILNRKLPLPNVHHPLAVGTHRVGSVAPRVESLLPPSTCRIFPLCLCGKPLSCPLAIGLGIVPADVRYRVLVPPVTQGGVSTLRLPPPSPVHRHPMRRVLDVAVVLSSDCFAERAVQHEAPAEGLRFRGVLCGSHELAELLVGDWSLVDGIPLECHLARARSA
mmetsp:Transcript_66663/g.206412  ORF Transcript_66663/g.206412 Transcript_66663/m.206412 type:complete len:258 (-) Transcript_66663:67-840(-)